jgi:hypothetical protein
MDFFTVKPVHNEWQVAQAKENKILKTSCKIKINCIFALPILKVKYKTAEYY